MTLLPSLQEMAGLLGGDVAKDGVRCPGPGHSPQDRSLVVTPSSEADCGFVLHSFANDDVTACKDYVRGKLNLPPFEPKKERNGGGKPFSPTVASFVYRDEHGQPYLRVDRTAAKDFFQHHWTGELWKPGAPKGPKLPYKLPELAAAPLTVPVYVTEGEGKADLLARLGFLATSASGGAGNWSTNLNRWFQGRNVFILPDNDESGRKHAELVAQNLNPTAASVRVVELPELPPKGDVKQWLQHDPSGARLVKECESAPLWEPSGAEADGGTTKTADDAKSKDDAEIERLARLSAVQYDHERKAAAKRLNVRASILDALVKAKRTELGLGGDDGKQGHAISFPEPEHWPQPVNGAELLNDLAKAIRRHVVMSDAARDEAALWVLHAHMIDCFLVSPRLAVTSPVKGCGKTTLLDVLGRLVPRPLPTANVTPAALFRVVEGYQPTLLVDEADTFLHDNDELRGVLNSGHRRGGTVLRTVGDDHEPRAFRTFCPTVISLIGALPDTLHDRSVTIDLKRRLRTETVEPFRPDRADHLDVLARKAVRWAQDNAEAIAEADPTMPDGVINREADNWRPLLAIAAAARGDWPERARKSAAAAHVAAGGDEASRLELLLGDIRDAFKTDKAVVRRDMFGVDQTEIASDDIVKVLVKLEGRPWAEMGKARKPLTQNLLARMLKALKPPIAPQKVGPKDARVSGYLRAHFEDAFERYLSPEEPSSGQEGASQPDNRTQAHEIRTSEISQLDTTGDGCPVVKREKANNDGLLGGCPVAKGGNGQNARSPSGGEPGLSPRSIRDLAGEYQDRTYAQYQESSSGDVDHRPLDQWLRHRLAELGVFSEFIEVEFKRVMQAVFAI
jgi:hypothetical protein